MSSESVLNAAAIRNQFYIQQLSTHEYRTILPYLSELQDYLIELLNDVKTPTIEQAYKYYEIEKDIKAKTKSLMGEWLEGYQLDLFDVGEQQADFAGMVLNKATTDFEAILPANEQISAAARLTPLVLNGSAISIGEMLKDFTDKQVKRTVQVVRDGFVTGRTTQQIIADIRRKKTGWADKSKADAETFVRTTLNHTATMARTAVYKNNDDILIGYKLVVTLDGRTSPICQFHGQTPDKVYLFTDTYQPRPPFHQNCRTTDVAVVKPEYQLVGDEGIVRAASGANGGFEIRGETTYYEFLKTQPASFQDESLGRTRGLIFRNSGLSQEEFKRATYDQFGKPLTIAQMRLKNKEIADYLDSDGFKQAFQ